MPGRGNNIWQDTGVWEVLCVEAVVRSTACWEQAGQEGSGLNGAREQWELFHEGPLGMDVPLLTWYIGNQSLQHLPRVPGPSILGLEAQFLTCSHWAAGVALAQQCFGCFKALTHPLCFVRMGFPGIAASWLWRPLQSGADGCQFHWQVQRQWWGVWVRSPGSIQRLGSQPQAS